MAPTKEKTPKPRAAKAAKPRAPRTTRSRKGGDGEEPTGKGSLVIVESPTKAKTIGKYLGRGFDVKATVGHVRDLPTRELGVDVDRNFEPKYVTIKGKTKTLADIKKAARTASRIFLATDPDREGEAIAWHVAGQLETKAPIHRVLFEEITKTGVERAMAHPQHIDDKKVEAQQARRILDRLVGYKASPILWKSIRTGLSAGRVQTVALRLIVEREREIRAFTAVEYWSIDALCAKNGQTFEAGLHKIDGHSRSCTTRPRRRRSSMTSRRCRSSSPRWRNGSGRSGPAPRSPRARCSRKRPRS
jgi:DNA topoisomerase-1